jgi:hypothetical protein
MFDLGIQDGRDALSKGKWGTLVGDGVGFHAGVVWP